MHIEQHPTCANVLRFGKHFYIYTRYKCGPPTLKCIACGHEIAA